MIPYYHTYKCSQCEKDHFYTFGMWWKHVKRIYEYAKVQQISGASGEKVADRIVNKWGLPDGFATRLGKKLMSYSKKTT